MSIVQEIDRLEPGDIVKRVREHLREASRREGNGDRAGAERERQSAEHRLAELETLVGTTILTYARRWSLNNALYFDDLVVSMYQMLRKCVCDLSACCALFETRFESCFKKRCYNAIRDTFRANQVLGKNSLMHAGLREIPLDDAQSPTQTTSVIGHDPHLTLEVKDFESHLENAIKELPLNLRKVVTLYWEGHSFEEIAAQLDVTSKTASAWLAKAYNQVQPKLP